MAGKSSRLFLRTKARATALDEKIKKQMEGRNLSSFTWGKISSPDVTSSGQEGDFMGRPLIQKLVDFIIEGPSKHPGLRRAASRFQFITGMPGCGKSFGVIAAVAHLHSRTAKANEALKTQIQNKEEAEKLRKDAGRRVMLLSADEFQATPAKVLYAALIMAYVNDTAVLRLLEDLEWDQRDALLSFISERQEQLIMVLDDANALDHNFTLSTSGTEASKLLEGVAGSVNVVVCASIKSKWRKLLQKTPHATYMLVCGGFDDLELCKFLEHYERGIDSINLGKTGRVPRLLYLYIHDQRGFKVELRKHEKQLSRFISKGGQAKLGKLLCGAFGARVEEFADILDTKCFYCGPNGTAECLTEYLRARTISWVSAHAKRMERRFADDEIRRLTSIAEQQSSLSAVGNTAEGATILSLRLKEPTIPLNNSMFKIRPQAVRLFWGKLTKGKMKLGKARMLYVPFVFNHTGVNLYYEDEQYLVAFHVTVSGKAVESHPHARRVAGELFQGVQKAKVIVWVVVGESPEEEPTVVAPDKEAGIDYYEVFMAFGHLDPALDVIDYVVRGIRGNASSAKPCPSCGKKEGESMGCTRCDSWFHSACYTDTVDRKRVCPECAVVFGVFKDDNEGAEYEDEYFSETDKDSDVSYDVSCSSDEGPRRAGKKKRKA